MNNAVSQEAYTTQHVALQLRDLFARDYPSIITEPRARKKLSEKGLPWFARVVYDACTVPSSEMQDDAEFEKRFNEWHKAIALFPELDDSTVSAFSVLSALVQLDGKDHVRSLQVMTSKAASNIWTPSRYKATFSDVPELNELTSTPFMLQVRIIIAAFSFLNHNSFHVQIITLIIPKLDASKQSMSEIKSSLMMSLGESVAEVVWAIKETKDLVQNIVFVQKELDNSTGSSHRATISKAANNSVMVILSLANKNQTDWAAHKLPEGLGDLISEEGKSKLASKIAEELGRSLRRRPTRRADIYDIFVDFYIDRGS